MRGSFVRTQEVNDEAGHAHCDEKSAVVHHWEHDGRAATPEHARPASPKEAFEAPSRSLERCLICASCPHHVFPRTEALVGLLQRGQQVKLSLQSFCALSGDVVLTLTSPLFAVDIFAVLLFAGMCG